MAPSSAGAYIARLPGEVRAMVDSLPADEQEVFSHLASYSAFSASSISNPPKKQQPPPLQKKQHQHQHQQQNQQNNVNAKGKNCCVEGHKLTFGCECMDCYLKYWRLWNSSPNREVIHKALELMEASGGSNSSSSRSRSPWRMGKKDKHQQKQGKEKPSKEEHGESSSVKNRGVKEFKEVVTSAADVESPPQESKDDGANHQGVEGAAAKNADKKSSSKRLQLKETSEVKPRSKQVAPLDIKEDLAAEVEDEELGGRGGGGRAPGKSQTFGSRASEALGFVCEKLLWMWNPRLRRRH